MFNLSGEAIKHRAIDETVALPAAIAVEKPREEFKPVGFRVEQKIVRDVLVAQYAIFDQKGANWIDLPLAVAE